MELVQIIASIIFLGSIVLVITGWIDSVIAALIGIILMILFGVMTEVQAFQFVDWTLATGNCVYLRGRGVMTTDFAIV